MDRRRFLGSLLSLLSVSALASFVYPLVRFLAPPRSGAQGATVTLKRGDVAAGAAKDIVVNNTPALLINTPDRGFIALSKVCTHLGCLVEFDASKKRLVCPCHAGVYTIEGAVVSGPPPRPLPKFPVKVQGDEVIVG